MAKKNILSKKYPHLIKEWCFEKNGDLTPDNVTYGSHKKVWWKCLKHEDHIWLASVQYRQYNGCPFCVGLAVTKSNCLATTHPNELKEWNFEKNINLTPENIILEKLNE